MLGQMFRSCDRSILAKAHDGDSGVIGRVDYSLQIQNGLDHEYVVS